MNELFGLPITTLAIILGSLLGTAVLTVAVLGVTNRTMFKFGLRNIPRRGLQSLLVVAGLALATLITTAAFVTGDTVDHSLTKDVYSVFGRSDLDITWNGERDFGLDQGAVNEGTVIYADEAGVDALEARFGADPAIDAFLPFLTVPAPVTNVRTGDAKPSIQLTGVDFERLARAGGLTLENGRTADPHDLGDSGVFLSERAAKDLHARTGDPLVITVAGTRTNVMVAGIVKDEIA
ncbi:MAG TPA: ABC transporter permease, partial [Tepidiformaceae bacterium]|nr:ABC transporter permease [Tepidiformaceae bacterium]